MQRELIISTIDIAVAVLMASMGIALCLHMLQCSGWDIFISIGAALGFLTTAGELAETAKNRLKKI